MFIAAADDEGHCIGRHSIRAVGRRARDGSLEDAALSTAARTRLPASRSIQSHEFTTTIFGATPPTTMALGWRYLRYTAPLTTIRHLAADFRCLATIEEVGTLRRHEGFLPVGTTTDERTAIPQLCRCGIANAVVQSHRSYPGRIDERISVSLPIRILLSSPAACTTTQDPVLPRTATAELKETGETVPARTSPSKR